MTNEITKTSANDDVQVVQVNQVEMLQAINRSEVDIQIATAKMYPRDLSRVLNQIKTYATMDKETAEDCFYVLRRKGYGGQDSVIEGLSVRMAEIIASSWGNMRVQTRIVGNDGKMVTVQAVCHDLESNLAVCKEVKRRITDKSGKTFSEDMQVVTGNAASSIAFRNAVLAVIPKAITKKIVAEVKQVALGQAIDMETSIKNCIATYAKVGVTLEMILSYLDIKSVDEIDKERLFSLRATWNAIKEGTTTVKETFLNPISEAKSQAEADKATKESLSKIEKSMKKSGGGDLFDSETGEVFDNSKK